MEADYTNVYQPADTAQANFPMPQPKQIPPMVGVPAPQQQPVPQSQVNWRQLEKVTAAELARQVAEKGLAEGTKYFLKSSTFYGILSMAASWLLLGVGLFDEKDLPRIQDLLVAAITFGFGTALSVIGRIKANKPLRFRR